MSDAETLYSRWVTPTILQYQVEANLWTVGFNRFLENGFNPIVTGLNRLARNNGTSARGRRNTVEQIWKIIHKVKERIRDEVAWELIQAIRRSTQLSALLDEFEVAYTGSRWTRQANQEKIDAARSAYLELIAIRFRNTGLEVKLGPMLGKGGMGAAVYLATDQFGREYACKIERCAWHKLRPSINARAQESFINERLAKLYEADVTTTCVDYTLYGPHRWYLFTKGSKVDWKNLSLKDVVSVFYDLHTLHNYERFYTTVELTQQLELVHLDIHPGNMMMFKGRLRLIDFGNSFLYVKDSPLGFFQQPLPDGSSPHLHGAKGILDRNTANILNYVNDWKSTLPGVLPNITLCQGCRRQYPLALKITTCMACGSKNLETAPSSKTTLEGLAKLKQVPVESLMLKDPRVALQLPPFKPEQYICLVLTVTLLKTHIGGSRKTKIFEGFVTGQNITTYSESLKTLPYMKQAFPEAALLVRLLLSWYDVMMNRLLNGEPYTALDAVKYFDPTGIVQQQLKAYGLKPPRGLKKLSAEV